MIDVRQRKHQTKVSGDRGEQVEQRNGVIAPAHRKECEARTRKEARCTGMLEQAGCEIGHEWKLSHRAHRYKKRSAQIPGVRSALIRFNLRDLWLTLPCSALCRRERAQVPLAGAGIAGRDGPGDRAAIELALEGRDDAAIAAWIHIGTIDGAAHLVITTLRRRNA